jgi:hypothetical protein
MMLAAAATGLHACRSVPHALDDIKASHVVTERTIEHRFDAERYTWFGALRLWGFLRPIPGLGGSADRELQQIEDPAEFCVENIRKLESVNLDSVPDAAEVVFWAGAIVEADPFPLSRVAGLRVLRRVVEKHRPSLTFLDAPESDYMLGLLRKLDRVKKLQDISVAGQLTDPLRGEFLGVIRELIEIPFVRAVEARMVARGLAMHWLAEPDEKVRIELWTAAQVLMARGALLQMFRGLSDSHEQVRIAAARQLTAATGPEILGRLVKKLSTDSSPAVRAALASLLGDAARIDDPDTEPMIEYLAESLRDPEPAVSVNAMESLGRLTGIGRHFDVEWWRRWWERRVLERPAGANAPRPVGAN